MKKHKVAHLTSVHFPLDVRILYKECRTLSKEGYEVALIAPYERDENFEGIIIRAVSKPKSRLERLFRTGFKVFRIAIKEKANLYHFHDPELIFVGVLLKFFGKKVVYDVHEDLPRQILNKQWIPGPLRKVISKAASIIETFGAQMFDGISAATPAIAKRFPAKKTVTVQNFPIVEEFATTKGPPNSERNPVIVYVGSLTKIRGISEMVSAMALLPAQFKARLVLAGTFAPLVLEKEISMIKGWENVDFLGWQDRGEISGLLGLSRIGLVVLHPTPNYLLSYPVKLFEYMASGLPVIASDFPLWREIISETGCGLLVKPQDPKAIADNIQWLFEHPREAEEMGKRGQKAVLKKYNWAREADKIITLYEKILG